MHSIFIIEDDLSLLEIAKHQIVNAGYQVTTFTSADDALKKIQKNTPKLILSDLYLNNSMNGDTFLKELKKLGYNIPFILMTANGSIDSAVECVRAGAWNYLTKPFRWEDMLSQINKSIEYFDIQNENIKLKKLVNSFDNFNAITGTSSPVINLKKQLASISKSDATVLIQGESGTGKELVAKCIHLNSHRKNTNFIAVNCGAIVNDLAESELFGHEKGAFTGAHQKKIGYFENANNGTLFLDEISELPLNLQVKLLRVLQESEVTPVGSTKNIPVNIRIITATNVDLKEAVRCGDFREDLYYRICVLPLLLPNLRQRIDDIESLSINFFNNLRTSTYTISKELLSKFKSYSWPGNIRELENTITRLHILNPQVDAFTLEHLPTGSLDILEEQDIPYEIPDSGIDLEDHMNKLIQSALIKCNRNQSKASKLLGITRSALIYRMQKHKIQ